MRAIDSLLDIAIAQGATELRLATDCSPLLFRSGERLALTMPATSARALSQLLGDILTAHETAVSQHGLVAFVYRSADVGDFDVTIRQRSGAEHPGLTVAFTRVAASSSPSASPPDIPAHPAPAVTSPPASPLPPAITSLLARVTAMGASDLHLSEHESPIVRIDGELRSLANVDPPDIAALLDDSAREQMQTAGSRDLGLDVPDVGRVRANIYRTVDGLSAALRILTRAAPRLAGLHLPAGVRALVDLPHGLVIVCGPTGSGKSSTLAALAQAAMETRPRVLITLEDPIEYRIVAARPGGLVRQREIGKHVPDFATGLRDSLREDPDILLIGEMRDAETISLALTAAETGHLVLTSLHSRTSASAIERIVDTYAPERQRQIRVQLADALRAVLAQRLLPRANGAGRVPAVEMLRVTHGVANLIREGRTAQIISALQAGREEGMAPLEHSLADLVRAGTVSIEAARAAANDPKALGDYLTPR